MLRLTFSGLILAGLLASPAIAQEAPASAAPASKAAPEYVKLTFRSTPSANVYYGKKLLGSSPVTIRRRKDSGPVDVIFKAAGYLRMASRAYSWSDDTVHVRLTPISQAHTLFGYKKPVEEDDDDAPVDDDDGDTP